MNHLLNWLLGRFMLRWVLANVVGWLACLYLTRVRIEAVLIIALLEALGAFGLGLAQRWALRRFIHIGWWWVFDTLLGVLCGVTLAYFVAPLLDGLWFKWQNLIIGALVGLVLGAAQWLVLGRYFRGGRLWISANLVGGALCGFLSLPLTPQGALLGGVALGLITGWALLRVGETAGSVSS